MKSRIFFKLLFAFVLVILAAALAFYLSLGQALSFPLQSVEQVRRAVHTALLISSVLAFVLATLFAAMYAHSISERLQRVARFASRLVDGDLSARLEEDAADELGDIARSLDAATRNLQESFAALETRRDELETLLNSMQEAVLAVDREGRVLWANQRMEKLLPTGVRRNTSVVQTVRDPNFLAAIQTATNDRSSATMRATSIVPGKTFSVTAAPMAGGGAVAVLHDLTEVERVEKTRRDFIANVSHELRTPLTNIQGYAETLLETAGENGSSRDFLEIIRKNATRMTRLTEDLLILAKVESGEQKLDLRPTLSSELIEDAAQNFRESELDGDMRLSVHHQAVQSVAADHNAIYQVFRNLIDNALKYARSGERLEIGSCDVEGAVEFFVRDFGPGIASEHLPRLFERFYRVDKARSRESGGTGLGLAIAKHIVLAHGGTIRAESELHHGTTFYFTLPAAAKDLADSTNVPARVIGSVVEGR